METRLSKPDTLRHTTPNIASDSDTEVQPSQARSTWPGSVIAARRASPLNVRQQGAERLRDDMLGAGIQRRHDTGAAAATLIPQQGESDWRLALHASPETGTSSAHEVPADIRVSDDARAQAAFALLMGPATARGDAVGAVRAAFASGSRKKIAAAMELHQLGKLDLNARDADGETLAHHIARTGPNSNNAWVTSDTQETQETLTLAERFALLKDAGVDFQITNRHNETPLTLALCLQGLAMETIVDGLLAAGVNPHQRNQRGDNLLHFAARFNFPRIAHRLMQHGVDHEATDASLKTALHLAAEHGSTSVVDTLLQQKAVIHAMDLHGMTPLHLAAQRGNREVVSILLGQNAPVGATDVYENTALHLAAKFNQPQVVSTLLRHNAPVNAADFYGTTALQLAAEHGNAEVVTVLLANDAPTESADLDGINALHLAAKGGGSVEIVEALLDKGASADAATNDGLTALHLAAHTGNTGVIKALLAKGANARLVDSTGRRALDLAKQLGSAEVVTALQIADADTVGKS